MRFSVYQVSRKGGRDKNEDRMGYCYTRSAGLFALADGMGGHPEGEVASQVALQTMAGKLFSFPSQLKDHTLFEIKQMLERKDFTLATEVQLKMVKKLLEQPDRLMGKQ